MSHIVKSQLLWLVVLFVSVVTPLAAQVTTSTVLGTVTDQSAAVIPAAQITLTDVGTGSQRTTISGEDGGYVIENLKAGEYQVLVSKSGFKQTTVRGIVVQVAQRARVNVTMEVGEITDQLDVQGTVSLIETDSSSVGKVIATRDVLGLPLNGRQFLQLATLTPGVQRTTSPPYMETTGGSVSANGMSNHSNNTMIDGIMNQESGAARMTFSPSVDMIQEFKIQTNTYDAAYGRTGGSQIEIVTKRGTTVPHGSAYYFGRNDALDARPLFQPGELPPFSRHQFGGSFGGRIPYSQKDFFFVSYEGLRSDQGLTAVLNLPPNALRQGDFSSIATTIYDPLTFDAATGRRQPFPNNVIPSNRLSPQARFFLQEFVPAPTGGGFINNFVSNPTQTQNVNQISVRYDRDFSEKDSLTLRYTRNRYDALLPRGDSGAATPLPGLGEDVNLWGQNHKIGWTHLFGPTALNTLNVGFSQYFQNRFNETTGTDYISQAGMQGINRSEAGIPGFQISGWSSISDNFVSPIRQPFNNYTVEDIFSKIKGKHSLKFGGNFLYHRTQSDLDIFTRGLINFGPRYTTSAVNAPGDQFNAMAEYLLGLPSGGFFFSNNTITDWRSYSTSGFVQDNWSVSQDLTINLGLRYEVYVRPYDTQDRMAAFDIETQKQIYPGSVPNLPGVPAGSLVAESLGYPRSLQFPTTWNNWAPRVGFAWRMLGDQKTVLRGGFGIFYNWLVIDSATGLALGPPWVPSIGIACNPDVPCVTLERPFSTTVVPTFSSNLGSKTNRTPYTQQYSLGIQRELSPTLSLEVGYVGNLGRKNLLRFNINQPTPGPGPVAPRTLYPQLSSLNAIETKGISRYDSLQTTLRKTYDSMGLVFLGAYTWSHALGDSYSGPQINELQPLRDFRNYQAEYGNTNYDVRHLLSLSWIYELPWGKGKPLAGSLSGIPNAIIGGWKFGGIANFRTGQYLTITDIVDNSNAGGSRPDAISDPNGGPRTISQWFDTGAFRRAAQFTFGNAGTGIVEGPGAVNFDLALHKDFPVRENQRIQFRVEFFNAFNHPNLGNPATAFGAGNFGTISGSGPGRSIQFGLRFDF